MTHSMFKGKKVVVMGLGLNGGGLGAAKFFCAQGAEVLVTDLKTEQYLRESIKKLKKFKIKYALGGHREEDFTSADLIIKNPDVSNSSPYLEIARKNNVPVETDVSLFFKYARAFVIGITGSKGKSTTASLLYHILRMKFRRVFLAGNIGISPLEILPKIKESDKVVLELSSFELENLKQSPQIAVITNIFPDHLNRYASMSEYIDAKKNIFRNQKKEDALFINENDPVAKEFARESVSNVRWFSGKNSGEQNTAAAREVAKFMDVPAVKIEKAISSFKGVPHRQELIAQINGVKFFDDTAATMPEAAIVALQGFSERFPTAKIVLICGGQNKGLQYKDLATEIKNRVGELILLPGTATDKIRSELGVFKINEVSSMKEAVAKAKMLAKKGDIVLLSPAAASFNLFRNEFDRGDQFKKEVKSK